MKKKLLALPLTIFAAHAMRGTNNYDYRNRTPYQASTINHFDQEIKELKQKKENLESQLRDFERKKMSFRTWEIPGAEAENLKIQRAIADINVSIEMLTWQKRKESEDNKKKKMEQEERLRKESLERKTEKAMNKKRQQMSDLRQEAHQILLKIDKNEPQISVSETQKKVTEIEEALKNFNSSAQEGDYKATKEYIEKCKHLIEKNKRLEKEKIEKDKRSEEEKNRKANEKNKAQEYLNVVEKEIAGISKKLETSLDEERFTTALKGLHELYRKVIQEGMSGDNKISRVIKKEEENIKQLRDEQYKRKQKEAENVRKDTIEEEQKRQEKIRKSEEKREKEEKQKREEAYKKAQEEREEEREKRNEARRTELKNELIDKISVFTENGERAAEVYFNQYGRNPTQLEIVDYLSRAFDEYKNKIFSSVEFKELGEMDPLGKLNCKQIRERLKGIEKDYAQRAERLRVLEEREIQNIRNARLIEENRIHAEEERKRQEREVERNKASRNRYETYKESDERINDLVAAFKREPEDIESFVRNNLDKGESDSYRQHLKKELKKILPNFPLDDPEHMYRG
jgi:hypothetical protein